MKKYLIFLLFLAFSTMLAAQQTPRAEQLGNQKRRETYTNQFGSDSMRYTIFLFVFTIPYFVALNRLS